MSLLTQYSSIEKSKHNKTKRFQHAYLTPATNLTDTSITSSKLFSSRHATKKIFNQIIKAKPDIQILTGYIILLLFKHKENYYKTNTDNRYTFDDLINHYILYYNLPEIKLSELFNLIEMFIFSTQLNSHDDGYLTAVLNTIYLTIQSFAAKKHRNKTVTLSEYIQTKINFFKIK